MKKSLTIGLICMTALCLVACGNNSSKKADNSSKDSSSLTAKKKADAKKASIKKAKAESENKAKSSSLVASSSKSTNYNSQDENSSSSQNTGINMDPNTLTGFLNKYGESPAAYKMDHEGMTAEQALAATPDDMETSGELQTEHSPQ